jgi:hypothetical protein
MCSLQQHQFSCAERALSAEGVAIHGKPAVNDGDPTDRYVTKGEKTYKLQFKFTCSSSNISHGAFVLSCRRGRSLSYKQGINDFYIFSVGAVTPTMLFLPECVLIKEGVIRTNTQPGKTALPSHAPLTAFQHYKEHVSTVISFLRSL